MEFVNEGVLKRSNLQLASDIPMTNKSQSISLKTDRTRQKRRNAYFNSINGLCAQRSFYLIAWIVK